MDKLPFRVLLPDGRLAVPRDYQIEDLTNFASKRDAKFTVEVANLKGLANVLCYVTKGGTEQMPFVVHSAGVILRLLSKSISPSDVRLVKQQNGACFLDSLKKFPDYDQIEDFGRALKGEPGVKLFCLKKEEAGIDSIRYIDSKQRLIQAVVPLTLNLFSAICEVTPPSQILERSSSASSRTAVNPGQNFSDPTGPSDRAESRSKTSPPVLHQASQALQGLDLNRQSSQTSQTSQANPSQAFLGLELNRQSSQSSQTSQESPGKRKPVPGEAPETSKPSSQYQKWSGPGWNKQSHTAGLPSTQGTSVASLIHGSPQDIAQTSPGLNVQSPLGPTRLPQHPVTNSGPNKPSLHETPQTSLGPREQTSQSSHPSSPGRSQKPEEAVDWKKYGEVADTLWNIYEKKFAFPRWSKDLLEAGELEECARTTVVYYAQGDDLDLVTKLATEREPVNIEMQRLYKKDKLKQHFGYELGAYHLSTAERLLPNIAIYTKTPITPDGKSFGNFHVINVVGYAFDARTQPDYCYFFGSVGPKSAVMPSERRGEFVGSMTRIWCYVFECARRHSLKHVYLASVGGGAFRGPLTEKEYGDLKDESLKPVLEKYSEIQCHSLPMIPNWCFSQEGKQRCNDSLLVNAWDPWSMVGNGNAGDNSLDGYFGRCSALAVLCWPHTNPMLRYEPVEFGVGLK